MTQKQHIIQAIKNLDFDKLYQLLDDNTSYMDVPKSTFINEFQSEVERIKNFVDFRDFNCFDRVVEGVCDTCNMSSTAYRFIRDKRHCLVFDLCFEEEKGEIKNIYICEDMVAEEPNEHYVILYFSFFKDECINFKPTLEHLILIQRNDKLIEEFQKLTDYGLIPIQEVLYWHKKVTSVKKDLGFYRIFKQDRYKIFEDLRILYRSVSEIKENYDNNHIAEKALLEYKNLDENDEKSIVKWLLPYEEEQFYSLKKTNNWKETGILILESEPNLVLDCSGCIESFIFEDLFSNRYYDLLIKYEPTKEHYEQNGGSVPLNLETHLKLHNKYLDLF